MRVLVIVFFCLAILFCIKNYLNKNNEKSKKEKWLKVKEEHKNKTVPSKHSSNYYRKNELSRNKERLRNEDNYYKLKGESGEKEIIRELEGFNVYHRVLSNLYIPYKKGVTEVDIVLITYTGIYVIESKNYKGWIFGREEDDKWTQMFSKESKFHFYNPIKQNLGHIEALHSILNKNNIHNRDYPYISYIIFGNECELKSIEANSAKVFNQNFFLEVLQEDILARQAEFMKADIDKIHNFLSNYVEVSDDIKKRHRLTVQRAKNYSKRKVH